MLLQFVKRVLTFIMDSFSDKVPKKHVKINTGIK